ncbi:helix-turn-helix domain-containing protein [Leucobacter sp.]
MIHDGSAWSTGFYAVQRTSLRVHPGVLEIVLVLRGSLDVTVSCERFALEEGDYAVLNEGDPHLLAGSDDNVTALLQIRLETFSEDVPHLDGIIYACESFDLPRFRRTEDSLRRLILSALLADGPDQRDAMAALLVELSDGYAFEDYYERQQRLTRARRLQFRRLVIAMQEELAARDVLGRIAQDHHYSKGSLSRIVREVAAVSFSDLLTWLRVTAAERMLIGGEATVAQIAADSGFSDVKYLSRAFRAWFGESPSGYRRRLQPLLEADDLVTSCPELGFSLASQSRTARRAEQGRPRLSVTPLLVKNLGGRADLFRTVAELTRAPLPPPAETEPPRAPHLLPIRVSGGSSSAGAAHDPASGSAPVDWADLVRGIDRAVFRPVLILPASDVELARSVAAAVAASNESPGTEPEASGIDCWIAYEGGLGVEAEKLAVQLHDEFGFDALPMRLG